MPSWKSERRMVKVVLDTVIIVRALIKPPGIIAVSDILDILSEATLINPSHKVDICRDPHDNKFIECAIAAGADYVVSGDEDLLSIKEYENTKIVSIDGFLQILDNLSKK